LTFVFSAFFMVTAAAFRYGTGFKEHACKGGWCNLRPDWPPQDGGGGAVASEGGSRGGGDGIPVVSSAGSAGDEL